MKCVYLIVKHISNKKNPLAALEEIGGKYIIDYEEIDFSV